MSASKERFASFLPKREQRLTMQDVQLLQLTATNKTNEAIGDEMNPSNGFFTQNQKNIMDGSRSNQTRREDDFFS
jgi:hypothetical protein